MNAMPNHRELTRIVEGEPTAAWLIVVTKANKELSTCHQLRNQCFDAYCPMRPLDAIAAKRRGVKAVPLFPRLIFARATLNAYRWQAIFSTYGVSSVMCDPQKPRGLKPEFVEAIRAREFDEFMSIGLVDPTKPAPPPKEKDPRKWVKLSDVRDGLWEVGVDELRKSVLVSLLNGGHAAITQQIKRT